MRVEVVQAGDTAQALAFVQELQFLRGLVVLVVAGNVERRRWAWCRSRSACWSAVAVGGDRLERDRIRQFPGRRERHALVTHEVVVAGARPGVVDVVEDLLAGSESKSRDFAVAMLGRGVVLDVVGRQPEAQRVGRVPVGAHAEGVDALRVVVLLAGELVLAVAIATVDGGAAADRQRVAERQYARGNEVVLRIGAERELGVEARLVAERLGHVLDRAADRVAAVQRALRAAQHFEALDVVNVEHGALRAGHVHVVNVETDAGLETPERVLLADAADEGDQRRVGAARHLQGEVGRGLLQPRDVLRADGLDAFGRECGHRDRHVLQRFLAAAGGDGDLLEAGDRRPGDGRVLREDCGYGEHRGRAGCSGLHRVNGELLHGSPCCGAWSRRRCFNECWNLVERSLKFNSRCRKASGFFRIAARPHAQGQFVPRCKRKARLAARVRDGTACRGQGRPAPAPARRQRANASSTRPSDCSRNAAFTAFRCAT